MNDMRKKMCAALLCLLSVGAMGQTVSSTSSGTNSPYSQYALGELVDPSGGVGKGMNGLGIAYRDHAQVNHLNPASYSAIDSLSFIFDLGLSGQISNFEEGNKRVNARSANFEYAVAGFRLARHLGFSFGVIPFSNIGYNYSVTKKIGTEGTAGYSSSYKGKGGLHEVYIGMGWEPFRGVSFGVKKPPVAMILMKSAPYLTCSRTALTKKSLPLPQTGFIACSTEAARKLPA